MSDPSYNREPSDPSSLKNLLDGSGRVVVVPSDALANLTSYRKNSLDGSERVVDVLSDALINLRCNGLKSSSTNKQVESSWKNSNMFVIINNLVHNHQLMVPILDGAGSVTPQIKDTIAWKIPPNSEAQQPVKEAERQIAMGNSVFICTADENYLVFGLAKEEIDQEVDYHFTIDQDSHEFPGNLVVDAISCALDKPLIQNVSPFCGFLFICDVCHIRSFFRWINLKISSTLKQIERYWTINNFRFITCTLDYNLPASALRLRIPPIIDNAYMNDASDPESKTSANHNKEPKKISVGNLVFKLYGHSATHPALKEVMDQDFDYDLNADEYAYELPDDLVLAILSWLPDKPLTRMKLISKSWYFTISRICLPKISPPSPSAQLCGFLFVTCKYQTGIVSLKFADAYNIQESSFASHMHDDQSRRSLLHFEYQAEDFQDCCNGLLLLTCGHGGAGPVQYVVLNPTTKEHIHLPVDPSHLHSEICYASLAFDPSNSLNYRVVRVYRSACDATVSRPPVLDVFWSETGKWFRHCIPLDPRVYGSMWKKRAIYINGVMYRLSYAKFLICTDIKAASSYTGDSPNLKASVVELPRTDKIDIYNSGFVGIIGASRGCLYYCNRIESSMLFWVLDNGAEWVLKHSIDMDCFCDHPLVKDLIFRHLYVKDSWFKTYALYPDSEEVLIGTPAFMIRYHLRTKDLKLIHQVENDQMITSGAYWVFPYARCPVIIKSVLQGLK